MLDNGKINISQFTVFIIIFTLGGVILLTPSLLVADAKQDGWISGLLGLGIGLMLVWLYCELGSLYPQKTLVECIGEILYTWLAKIVSFLFLSYFFILAALTMRNLGDFMTTQVMPNTPIQAILIIFVSMVIMGTRLGIETLIRTTETFFPWVILLLVLLFIMLSPQIQLEKMQPVFEQGMKPILLSTFPFLGLPFLQLEAIIMIFPHINQPNKIKKAFLVGVLIGGIILVLITLYSILIIGQGLTGMSIYPSYVLAKKIDISHFVQRIEALVAFIWIITVFVKVTFLFYATAIGSAQILKLKDFRFLTYPLGILLVLLSIVVSPNIAHNKTLFAKIWTPYSFTFGLFFPLLLLGVAKLKGRR
jgi:spore germination protein KB